MQTASQNKTISFLLVMACIFSQIIIQAQNKESMLQIEVSSKGESPVESATVKITNTSNNIAILVTSVEFEGQMPELTYFYHGVYGSIYKDGDNYVHNSMAQQLSRPLSKLFLLPEQSASWSRPIRVVKNGYKATVSWIEIPKEKISAKVWVQSDANQGMNFVFEPLSKSIEADYRKNPKPVIIEGEVDEKTSSFETSYSILGELKNNTKIKKKEEEYIEVSLDPIEKSVVIYQNNVFVRGYNYNKKEDELTPYLISDPTAIDFLYYYGKVLNKPVPFMLSKDDFNDLVEVKESYTDMYYYPGITEVPFESCSEIINRAFEKDLKIKLQRIDPNGLGRQLVLTIGLDVNNSGRHD